jgi:DNA-binding MarR family transcriptional regulator
MSEAQKLDLIRQVMGAANVFCSAVERLLDDTIGEASGGTLAAQQIKLLLLIARPGHRYRVMDIAAFLGVTNAAASRAVDRLVQRGLVDRTISPDDRRAVDLALTPSGRDLLDRFGEVRNERMLEVLGGVSDSTLHALMGLMDELSPRLVAAEPGSDERCLRCGVDARANCVLRDMMGDRCAAVALPGTGGAGGAGDP